MTNAVKHFKYELKGRKRLHKKAHRTEIEHCRWWLMKEIAIIKPKLIVAMGSTALFSLTGLIAPITRYAGSLISTEENIPVLATVHPSYLLRITSEQSRKQEIEKFEQSLRLVRQKTALKNTLPKNELKK